MSQQDYQKPADTAESVTLVSVIDGDTVDVRRRDGVETIVRIRLWGIDAPEPGQALSREATSALESMLDSGRPGVLWMEKYSKDPNPEASKERVSALLYWDQYGRERSVNREMARRGFAHVDTHSKGRSYRQQLGFYAAESEAREYGRGIWSIEDFARIHPATYRQMLKRQGGQQDALGLIARFESLKELLLLAVFLLLAVYVMGAIIALDIPEVFADIVQDIEGVIRDWS